MFNQGLGTAPMPRFLYGYGVFPKVSLCTQLSSSAASTKTAKQTSVCSRAQSWWRWIEYQVIWKILENYGAIMVLYSLPNDMSYCPNRSLRSSEARYSQVVAWHEDSAGIHFLLNFFFALFLWHSKLVFQLLCQVRKLLGHVTTVISICICHSWVLSMMSDSRHGSQPCHPPMVNNSNQKLRSLGVIVPTSAIPWPRRARNTATLGFCLSRICSFSCLIFSSALYNFPSGCPRCQSAREHATVLYATMTIHGHRKCSV